MAAASRRPSSGMSGSESGRAANSQRFAQPDTWRSSMQQPICTEWIRKLSGSAIWAGRMVSVRARSKGGLIAGDEPQMEWYP